MVKADIGNDGQIRSYDVGAIQASSHAHFDNGDIHFGFCKIFKSQSRCQFKERRVQRFEERAFVFDKRNHFAFRYHLSVYPYALSEIGQVR